MSALEQLLWLFILAIPVACISWTITHEEVFREPRDWCARQSDSSRTFLRRKFFYLLTCEYCFSHYVTAAFLAVTRFTMLYSGWRGYLIAGFSLVWVANLYMSAFGRLRLDIKHENIQIEADKEKTKVHQHSESSTHAPIIPRLIRRSR
jgi:hypothetical protein